MAVSDIIGTNAGAKEETVDDEGNVVDTSYSGKVDPYFSKLYFGIWSMIQVASGIYIRLRKWNIDNDDS